MENLILSCIESRVESNRKFYGRFQLGPFEAGQGLTVANALRRTLLADISGIAIVAVEIENAQHEYSTIRGIKESVLDILLNLKQIVLTSQFQISQLQFGYLQVQGPAIVKAKDLKLPVSIQCVDPEQYIASVSYNGVLNLKFVICQGTNYISFSNLLITLNQQIYHKKNQITFLKDENLNNLFLNSSSNLLPIEPVFMPIEKANFLLDTYFSSKSQKLKDRILLEVWTNGSIHPRQAIHDAVKTLIELFTPFQETRLLKSIFFNSRQVISSRNENEKKITSLDIGNLDLSLRPYTCLKRAKIHTIGDLLTFSSEDLLLLKNFGKRSLEEVENSLNQIGLKLKNSNELKNKYRI